MNILALKKCICKPPSIALALLVLLFSGCTTPGPSEVSEDTVTVRDASLFVKTMGSGEPIVFVHGGPGLEHSYFLPHVAEMAKKNTLVFYDQRANGRSEIGDTTAFTMDQFVEDLDAVRQHIKADKIHLLGHSWGGLIAMRYALKHQDKLHSLILMNTNAASAAVQQAAGQRLQARITPADQEAQAALFQTEAFQKREPAALNEFFRLSFKSSFFDPEKTNELSFYFDEQFSEKSAALGRLRADSTLPFYDLHDNLGSMQTPTLIIHTTHDPLTLDDISLIDHAIPNSKLVVIENSGHFPFIEQYEDLSRHIQDFLTDH
ncbi:MAG: alpha/beta fold hydrolase [Rhodothermales bacterium]